MTSYRRGFAIGCATALLLTGCGPAPEPESQPTPEAPEQDTRCLCEPTVPLTGAPGEAVSSSAPRELAPGATPREMAAAVAGNTNFGAALLRLSQPGANVFFSPYSISQALSMVYAGARGQTETQMSQVLGSALSQARHHPAMNAVDLAMQPGTGGGTGGTPPTFRVVNGTWGRQGFTFEPTFLDVLARQYGAGMRVVDFSQNASAIRAQINQWVEEQTMTRIKDLIPVGGVKPDTTLMLVNALYFKGAWATPFSKQGTADAPFQTLDGKTRQVPTMRGGTGQYMAGQGFEAVSLDYQGREFRMLVVLPAAGRFAEVEGRLSSAFLEDVRSRLSSRYMDIRLPRFEMETALPLIPSLSTLGMPDAFSSQANFSGIARGASLTLASVSHKAFVSVNELGTEAAAATEVGVGPPSVPELFAVNRPFLFAIEHVATRNVLFLGRYVSP
ncbi:serpin family protein [Melittangium boletus]|uniref:serpin family protein n=1 Tax=Melittangium boletus TaxID=83453 RepID=UPI003DA4061F